MLVSIVRSLPKRFAYRWNHQACFVKQAKFNFNRYRRSQSEETRRSSGRRKELHGLSKRAISTGRHSFSFYEDVEQSRKKRVPFRMTGKRYELRYRGLCCLTQVILSIAISGQRLEGSMRWCDWSKLSAQSCRLLFEPRKRFVRISDIFEYSQIFEQFVSTLVI